MRFDWDPQKDDLLVKQRGFSFEKVSRLFQNPHLEGQKTDDPEQYYAIGFVNGKLLTLIFEYREDELGLYVWLITYWHSSKSERIFYAKNFKA